MPAKRLRLKCQDMLALLALVLLVPLAVKAQTGQMRLQGVVSETVALSALPNLIQSNVHTDVVNSGNTVRITLSGANMEASVIRVPLLVRSNTNFKISAAVETRAAALSEISIEDVRANGTLVSPAAISNFNVLRKFDLSGLNTSAPSSRNLLDDVLVLSGPRVSLGGTLDSRNNALQITVLIDLKPQPDHEWSIRLTFVGTPE
jgi:hypothetical protein